MTPYEEQQARLKGYQDVALERASKRSQGASVPAFFCVHCHEAFRAHADGCCLFAPTKFEAATDEWFINTFGSEER